MPEKKNFFQRLADRFAKPKEDKESEKAADIARKQKETIQKMRDEEAAKKNAAKTVGRKINETAETVANKTEEAKRKTEELAAGSKHQADERLAKKAAEEAAKAAGEAEAAAKAILATHTIRPNETLSSIALEYYGHATPPYYKHIYEFNKAIIGNNMNLIRPGETIQIPALPEELQKPS
jgi:nucleoid-associated protein YgaU